MKLFVPSSRGTGLQTLLVFLAATSTLSYAADPPATATQPSYSELVDEVRALRAEVTQMRVKERNYVSAADVDAVVRRVFEDAERRSRILNVDGLSAGWNGERFVIGSKDGNYTFQPMMIWQLRYVAGYQSDLPNHPGKDDSIEDGFENRRARLGADGNLINKNLTYRFLMAGDRAQDVIVLDAFAQYQITPDWAIRGGQFKDPWTQEENVSGFRQLAVDRPILNAIIGGLNTGWVQGAEVIYGQAKPWRARAVIHDGANSRVTPFDDATTGGIGIANPVLAQGENDYGTTARVEHFFKGTPKQYQDYTALGNKEDLLVLGAGFDFTQAGDNSGLFHAVDIQWENAHGWSAYAEYMALLRSISSPSTGPYGVAAGDFYDYGLMAQTAYLFTPKWEAFGRYSWVNLDEASFNPDRPNAEEFLHEFTVGMNYYVLRHNCKLTIDLSYLPNGSPEIPALGYLATGENGIVLRTQFTLSF